MVVTVTAAWLIGSLRPGRRTVGFWCFLTSNLLWVIWGWHAGAWALITLQVCLAAMNIRGVKKNDDGAARAEAAADGSCIATGRSLSILRNVGVLSAIRLCVQAKDWPLGS